MTLIDGSEYEFLKNMSVDFKITTNEGKYFAGDTLSVTKLFFYRNKKKGVVELRMEVETDEKPKP